MVPRLCVNWSVLFSKCWGAFLRAPCRVLKPQKIDSPCNFVQKWLFFGTFNDFFYFCKLAQILLVMDKNKNENKWRGVTILLWTGGQRLPTPIYTSIPPPHKHTQTVSKTLEFVFGQSWRTNRWTDKSFYRVVCPQLRRGKRKGKKFKKKIRKTRPGTRPIVVDGWAGVEMRVVKLSNSIIMDGLTDYRMDRWMDRWTD